MADIVGLLVGLGLTLAIFSYLVGDNPIYRLAVHVLVGVTAAYGVVIALRQVIIPGLVRVATTAPVVESVLWIVPLLLALLLLMRTIPRVSWVGQSSVAALIGIGAAVALTGAVAGTLVPQVLAFAGDGGVLTLVTALLTIGTLLSFQLTRDATREEANQLAIGARRTVQVTGRLVLAVTFGALFASALSTSLLLLVERIDALLLLAGL